MILRRRFFPVGPIQSIIWSGAVRLRSNTPVAIEGGKPGNVPVQIRYVQKLEEDSERKY